MRVFYEEKDANITSHRGNSLAYSAHVHSHLELVFMISGQAKAFVDGKECKIESNDAFIVFPNQIHMYEKLAEEDYYIFIFPEFICYEFQNLFRNKIPVSPVVKGFYEDPRIRSAVEELMGLCQSSGKYSDAIIRGYLLILLGNLSEKMAFEDVQKQNGDLIKKILYYCSENYMRDIGLDSIAKELHINRCYVSYLFRQKLQIGFNDYINLLRISDACDLLGNNEGNITDIAHKSGFNSARSFNRAFSKHVGMTPRDYRKNRSPVKTYS